MKYFWILVLSMMPMYSVLADNGLPDSPFMEIKGKGVVYAKPDYVEVKFAVKAHAETGADARKEVDEKLVQVAHILKELKLPDDAFEAYKLSVESEGAFGENGKWRQMGYQAAREGKITIRDLDRAQEIMDALTKSPIDTWDSVSAKVNDEESLKLKAREAAFKDARERAEVYARMAGKSVGEVFRIGDESLWQFDFLESAPMLAEATITRGHSLPVFQVNRIEITQNVNVIFLLE